MGQPQVTDFIQAYIDKFSFVEAKKYLALKGPLGLKVIQDNMYPLLRFDNLLVISHPPQGRAKAGMLACYWENDLVNPCYITKVYPDGSFKVRFINREDPPRLYSSENFLGEIISPKLNLWWKLKLKLIESELFYKK